MGPLKDARAGQGSLWVVEPASGDVRRVEIEWDEFSDGTVEFHPLGIEVEWDKETGTDRLFVVNHRANESTVEIFTFFASPSDSDPLVFTATHLARLSHPSFTGAPNSLAVLSPTSFFLSHDHRFNRRSGSVFGKVANFLETILALPLSVVDLVQFQLPRDGRAEVKVDVTRVINRVAFANGLALSPTKDTLVVASTTRSQLLFYRLERSASAPRLSLTRTVSLPFLVDNLSLLPSDPLSNASASFTVLAAGHPSYLALLSAAHRLPIDVRLPSLVRSLAAALGLNGLARWRLEFDSRRQDGMSWVVAVAHPPLASSEIEVEAEGWETVFQSHGRPGEGGFGGSTTGVVGRSGERARWMVVSGLYSEGVRVVRET